MTATQKEFPRWNDPGARQKRIAQEVERILVHLDPKGPRQGTDDTPERVARMYVEELCSGYQTNIEDLYRTFPPEGDGMVIIKKVPLVSLCEHHLVPFIGHANVGYIPQDKIIGLSKIKRVVDVFARRLQIQERLTSEITDSLNTNLEPQGVIVVVEAEHLCMTIRGVQAPGTTTVTSSVRGVFNENKEGEKEEFLRLINGK